MTDGSSVSSQWTAAGIWVAALSFLGLLIRQLVPWRKQVSEDEAHLRSDLLRRVQRLERTLDRERTRHNAERARHEAERALDRHRLNNVTQCFDALLLLIEAAPEKAAESVAKIKEMRAQQLKAESQEKAIIRAAEIEAQAAIEAEISEDREGEE